MPDERARSSVQLVFRRLEAVAITAAAPVDVWTPAAGKRFRLQGWALSSSAGAALILLDQAVVILRTELLAAAGAARENLGDRAYASVAVNNVLRLDVTANATVSGYVWGYEE